MEIKKKCKYCRIEMNLIPDHWALDKTIKLKDNEHKYENCHFKEKVLVKLYACKECGYIEMFSRGIRSKY